MFNFVYLFLNTVYLLSKDFEIAADYQMVFIRCISLISSRSNICFQFSANIVKPIECEVKSAKSSAKQHEGRCCNGSDYANRISSYYDIP